MGRGVKMLCVGGGQNNMGRGVDIPWVGVQIHVHFVIKLNIFYLYVALTSLYIHVKASFSHKIAKKKNFK